MTTHVKEHCEPPLENRKNRLFEGMLWACDCGKIYRYSRDRSIQDQYGKPYFNWQEFKL